MKKKNHIILSVSLAIASLASVAQAGLLVQTEPDVLKTAFIGESQRFAFPKTDFDKTNGVPETYQWFALDPVFGFASPIADATNRVYDIASVQPTDAAYRFVRVSDGTTTEFSAFIALTVKQDGVLIENVWSPDSVYVTLIHQGEPFEFAVQLTDFGKSEKDANNLTFQWYRVDGFGNQTAIPGATSRKYSVASGQISDVSFYTVSVNNGTTTEQPPELYELEVEVP